MTAREVLDALTPDERSAFLLSSVPSVAEAFDCAATFGDDDSIRGLRVVLAPVVRDREFQRAVDTLQTFAVDQDERGVRVRRMLRELSVEPCLPESVDDFLRAFALVAAKCLRDTKSRAGQRRGQLLKALLDEARSIEERRAA